MAFFLTIVEFPDAGTSAEWEDVRTRMSALGFSPTIEGSTGKVYRLPKNTFYGDLEGKDLERLRDEIKDSLINANPNIRLIVTEGQSYWFLPTL